MNEDLNVRNSVTPLGIHEKRASPVSIIILYLLFLERHIGCTVPVTSILKEWLKDKNGKIAEKIAKLYSDKQTAEPFFI